MKEIDPKRVDQISETAELLTPVLRVVPARPEHLTGDGQMEQDGDRGRAEGDRRVAPRVLGSRQDAEGHGRRREEGEDRNRPASENADGGEGEQGSGARGVAFVAPDARGPSAT